jgi:Zn-finger nucleic acid-binding protein
MRGLREAVTRGRRSFCGAWHAVAMPTTRSCPDCKRVMRELRHQDVAVDACECGGMWFDHGELAAWRASHTKAAAPNPVLKPRPGAARRCPHCAASSLRSVWLDKVPVASCSQCQGIWLPGAGVAMFDRGSRNGATDAGDWLSAVFEFVGHVVVGALS